VAKRRVTPTQLRNLERGREINFQNQLRRKGIPQTIVQREIIRQPVVNQNTTHQHITQVKLSLFKELIGAKIFPIEINNKKENLNLQDMIRTINSRLDRHWEKISLNKNKIDEIISYINSKEKEDQERFKKIEKRLADLEKENVELREQLKDGGVYHDLHDFSCLNESCTETITSELIEECGTDYCNDYGENYCKNDDMYRNRTCYNSGCLGGSCFKNEFSNEELIQECLYGCSAGECIPENYSIDVQNPKGEIYSDRRIPFEITSFRESTILEYIDNSYRTPRWKRICRNCDEYSKTKSFRNGEHNITIKGISKTGSEDKKNILFFVDYKDPRISKTEPRRGFSDGNFYVEFREDNPENLTLHYGNSIRTRELNIKNDCDENRGKHECSVWVNLSDFDNKEIEYWFELEDMAGNKDDSKKNEVSVDMTDPVLNNPDSFWERGIGRYSKYIYFDISITEKNFDEAVLSYDYRGRTKEKRLCSRLRYGICEKRFTMRDDYTNLKLIIRDEAGNEIEEDVLV